MYGFEASDAVTLGEGFVLYRRPQHAGLRITGSVTDAVSAEWKRAMRENFSQHGHPRFVWLDLEGAEPENSMGERFRTASYAREALRKVEWCALYTGRSSRTLVVLRAMLRLIGAEHFALYDDALAWRRAVDAMREGRRPTTHLASVPPPR